MKKDNGRSPLRGSGCQPSASAASADATASSQSGIPNALRALASRLPEGLRWSFEMTLTGGGRVEYTWKLVGPRGGIHVSAWPDSLPRWDRLWLGGIEGHSPKPREYEAGRPPSHDHCWLIGAPCWHDGSSLQFSEQIAPYLPDPSEPMREMDHALVLSEMLSRYRSWLPAASGIEAAAADETRSGSAEGESPAPEGGDAR